MSRVWPPEVTATGRVSLLVIGLIFCSTVITACGVVGPPIPPEDVGLAKKLREQEERERTEAEARRTPGIEGQAEPETPLPSITPMGPH